MKYGRKKPVVRKVFAKPYITIMGNMCVRYLLLPAPIHYHSVMPVYHHVQVQPDIIVKIPSNQFHCVRCKLLGTLRTMQEYTCN